MLALPVGLLLTYWPGLHAWSEALEMTVDQRGGGWRVLRDGLAYVAIPALLAAGAVLLLLVWRRSRRDAVVLGVGMLAANLGVQAIKHPLFLSSPMIRTLDPLSGHVGVAGAVALAWVLSRRPGHRRPAALCAILLISGTGIGVVLASWHSVAQVVCPFFVVAGVMTITDAVLSPTHYVHSASLRQAGVVPATLGAIMSLGALVVAVNSPPPNDSTLPLAMLCLAGIVLGVVSTGVGLLLACRPDSQRVSVAT